MSVGVVDRGAGDAAADVGRHHGGKKGRARAGAAAAEERKNGQRSLRAAGRDGRVSYEAFERAAQQRVAKGLAGGVSGSGKGDTTRSQHAEGDGLGIGAVGSSVEDSVGAPSSGMVIAKVGALALNSQGVGMAIAAAAPVVAGAPAGGEVPAGYVGQAVAAVGSGSVALAVGDGRVEVAASTASEASAALGPETAVTGIVGAGTDEAASLQGSFPALVAGQLVELDLYMVGQRVAGTVDGVRRLFLSLNSAGLGSVQVTAEARENRLRVLVAGDSTEAFSEQVRAVGELASRLGFRFDTVEQATHSVQEPNGADGLDRLL